MKLLKEYIRALITEEYETHNEKAIEIFDMFSEKFLTAYNAWLKKGRYRYNNARIPVKYSSQYNQQVSVLAFYVDDKPEPQYHDYKGLEKLSVLAYHANADKIIIPQIIVENMSHWMNRYGEFDSDVFYVVDADIFIRLMKIANTYDELIVLVRRMAKK